jgi:hypothetical protein
MQLTTRARRRLAVGAALACAAIATPVAIAASAASGAPAHPAAAAAPGCRAAATEVWLGLPGNGAAGTTFYQLEFSNIGRGTCTLFGHPGVSGVDRSGHQAGLPASWTGVPRTVTLAPGATSHVILAVTSTGSLCTNPVTAARLRVYPPGQTVAKPVFLSVQVCPHRVTLRVAPVRAGTGVPGFTTS